MARREYPGGPGPHALSDPVHRQQRAPFDAADPSGPAAVPANSSRLGHQPNRGLQLDSAIMLPNEDDVDDHPFVEH